ncbi:MAG: pyrimidine 5'-nucleotidase [Candidatus Eisenbacteria bacterium]
MIPIRHWLFDLDDTLYPASTGLFAHVSRRITRRIADALHVSEDEARIVQRGLWRKYGTSLRGLQVEHGLDPEPFLADVHDVPVEEILTPDPALSVMLGALPGDRHVFTNGPSEFVARVLARLGVTERFTRVFDIRHAEFVPKPDPHPYERVLGALEAPPNAIVMVDDSPQNLAQARALGMWTVWLRSPHSLAGGSAGSSIAALSDRTNEQPPHATIDCLVDLPAAVEQISASR